MFKYFVLPVLALCAPLPIFAATGEGAFNPAVSLILSGTYGQFNQDAALPATGFAMAARTPAAQGFNLGESELGVMANIDPDFRGTATMALSPAGGISVENAFAESLSLDNGLNLKLGRFFSGLGYLNDQHAHAWDFVDQPLVYRSLWNNQLGEDGVQLKWLAPTDMFVELGMEIGKGRNFHGTDTAKNGRNANVILAHIGDDVGNDSSWRLGASLHQTQRLNALSENVPDAFGNSVSTLFSGNSKTAGVDFIWKYSPNGNITHSNLKIQGEYFQRTENGMLTYVSTNQKIADTYANIQSGWYVQSVYQFVPRWRVGARYDQMQPGIAQIGNLNTANLISDYAYQPKQLSLMLDFSPSEFSRFRLQLARDESRQNLPDNQLFVQYIMSLGAHGAHKF